MFNNYTCALVIPTKNEASNLKRLLPLIPDFIDQIFVIDANSDDNTEDVVNESNKKIKLIKQLSRGKGGALAKGLASSNSDFTFIIDADGSMDPSELKLFAEYLVQGVSIVKGSRFMTNAGSDDITKFRQFGNAFLTKLANLLYRVKWTDLAYGYAAFSKSAIKTLNLDNVDFKIPSRFSIRNMAYGQGFEIETLIFCRAVRRGLVVKEIPSWENNRWEGDSNLKSIPDGLRALTALLLERITNKYQPYDLNQ
jgi:glycosyltransferase involved in cell wall biosynthesis